MLLFVSLLFFVVKMKPTSVEDAPHVPFSVRIYLARAETRSRREGLAEGDVGCSPRREGGSRKDPKTPRFSSSRPLIIRWPCKKTVSPIRAPSLKFTAEYTEETEIDKY